MFNKTNTNIGGTQTIVSKSKEVIVINQSKSNDEMLLSEIDLQQIVLFADRLSEYKGAELKQSEKIKLAASLYEISEEAKDVDKCVKKIGEFKNLFDMLDDIGKKTIISIATGILSKIVLNLLGLV